MFEMDCSICFEAGRIGSGRFDRGERDDRQRGEAPGQKGITIVSVKP